jgi:hypothetical protein
MLKIVENKVLYLKMVASASLAFRKFDINKMMSTYEQLFVKVVHFSSEESIDGDGDTEIHRTGNLEGQQSQVSFSRL